MENERERWYAIFINDQAKSKVDNYAIAIKNNRITKASDFLRWFIDKTPDMVRSYLHSVSATAIEIRGYDKINEDDSRSKEATR